LSTLTMLFDSAPQEYLFTASIVIPVSAARTDVAMRHPGIMTDAHTIAFDAMMAPLSALEYKLQSSSRTTSHYQHRCAISTVFCARGAIASTHRPDARRADARLGLVSGYGMVTYDRGICSGGIISS